MAKQKMGKKSRKRKKKNAKTTITMDPIAISYGQTVSLPFDPKDPGFLKAHGFDPNLPVNVKKQLQMSDARVENRWIDIPDDNLTGLRLSGDEVWWDKKGLPPTPMQNNIRRLYSEEISFDVQGIPVSIKYFSTLHFPNVPNSVVKFTDPKYAPRFCGSIQLGTPAYYRSLPITHNTENTRDELESIIDDEFADNAYNDDSYCMYCTTIADDFRTGRKISEDYQSAVRIESPSKFAEVLGQEFAEQFIGPFKDQHPHEELRVEVVHGFVHYVEETNERMDFTGFMKSLGLSPKYVPYFLPFLKRKRYENQQEYRFVIRPIGCGISDNVPDERRFYLLKTSRNIFNLMSWVQPPIPNELILLYHDRDQWVSVRAYDFSNNGSRDINLIKAKQYIDIKLLDRNVSQFFETGMISVLFQNGALIQGDAHNIFAFGITFKGYPYRMVLKNISFLKDNSTEDS